ncbi:methyl-accepting chemotaxis protein [Marispirochaeta aestuarii]|uniref:methyl-accepting chemotaxis protein n=1 Tax=Marispirochaeta aestuarii TaxID=1963862 RepID=UPI0029C6260C|nr:methyl-accepting chemotaxis protein [Marispirochaeta aestuarii]
MKISRKLQIESIIILMLLSGSLAISLLSIREIQKSVEVFEKTRSGVAAAGKLDRDVLRLFTVTLDILLSESGEIDQDRLLELRLSSSRINQSRQSLAETMLLPEQTAAVIDTMDELYSLIESRLIEPIYNRKEVDPSLLRELLYSKYTVLAGEFGTLSSEYTDLSDTESGKIRALTRYSLIILLLFFALACCSSLVLSWLNQRWIIRPIKHTIHLLDEIASGSADLSIRLPRKGNDEVSILCGNVNKFVESLERSTNSLKSVSSESRGISESLSDNTDQTHREILLIESSIKEMETRISDLRQDVHRSTHRVSGIHTGAQELRRAAHEQKRVINNSADTTLQVLETLTQLSRSAHERLQASRTLAVRTEEGYMLTGLLHTGIQKVHATTDSILEAINLITAVSEQTKILSMNAAIEAAHVGDAGKGFAVISEEIRRLSDSTGESTGTIIENLRNMAEQLESLRKNSHRSMEIIDAVREETESFSASFQELTEKLKTTAEWGDGIVSSLGELSSGSEQFHSSAVEMAREAEGIHQGINSINDQFAPLLKEIQRISSGGTTIARSVLEIEALTSTNRDHVERIDKSLSLLIGDRSPR